mgnify:CR=1 FL=1
MVNYPHKIGKKITRTSSNISQHIDFANRGMSFESAINESNAYYLAHGLAVIHKKPTPVQIVKVDYPSRNKARIVEAYYQAPSTTDYNGIYKHF